MSVVENNWWAEKYRPKTIEDYSGNTEMIEYFKSCIDDNSIPHLLLHNEKSGTGKCLDFSEEIEIEIELSEAEIKKYSRFLT
jgi:hypothetical protein